MTSVPTAEPAATMIISSVAVPITVIVAAVEAVKLIVGAIERIIARIFANNPTTAIQITGRRHPNMEVVIVIDRGAVCHVIILDIANLSFAVFWGDYHQTSEGGLLSGWRGYHYLLIGITGGS
jgi:hypothetical protein